jgi:hypothetical protein
MRPLPILALACALSSCRVASTLWTLGALASHAIGVVVVLGAVGVGVRLAIAEWAERRRGR